MHLKCCSITTRVQIKVVEQRVAHPRALASLKKNSRNEQVMHIQCPGVKNTTREFLDCSTTHEHHHVHA
jgi:hypothetical protein